VDITPLSSPSAEPVPGRGPPPPQAAALARLLERQVRDARALDTEALCIAPGAAVWALKVDVRVLDDAGNLGDACALASVAALLHFRRPDVSIEPGGKVVVHSYTERAPLPLAVHHIPVCVSFGLASPLALQAHRRAASGASGGGAGAAHASEVLVLDPDAREAAVCDGTLTFVMNAHGELCGVHKLGGCPLPRPTMGAAARTAGEAASRLVAALKAALTAAEVAAGEAAMRAHAAAAGYTSAPGVVDVDVALALGRVGAKGSSVGAGVGAGARAGSASATSRGPSGLTSASLRVLLEGDEEDDGASGSAAKSTGSRAGGGGRGGKLDDDEDADEAEVGADGSMPMELDFAIERARRGGAGGP
jgi:exosome complex component RRP45